MKTPHEESTYALLVRSEERSRAALEIVLYAFFILSAVFSIWQFANQPYSLQLKSAHASSSVACLGEDGKTKVQC